MIRVNRFMWVGFMNTKMTHHASKSLPSQSHSVSLLWYVAAATTLLVSLLPNIILNETTGGTPSWLFGAKLALLGTLIVASSVWMALRPLQNYLVILLVLFVAERVSGLIGATSLWQSRFSSTSFEISMFGNQLLRLSVALVMIATLFVVKRRRSQFYLTKGELSAMAEPVPWLGVNKPISWRYFGAIVAFCISFGTLVFLLLAGIPQGDALLQVLMTLPVILLLAAMNAFSEELNYRAALLSTLNGVVSQKQAVLISAAFFGIGHYYGVPYGIVGVMMSGFLGWLLGKAMLETKGFFWPWLIHFLQDVLIFAFMAMGAVVAGGR